MAAFTCFSLLRNYATTGRIVAIVRASPRFSSSPTSINFLTPNHLRRYLCRASPTHDEEAAAKAAAINADTGAPTIFDKIIAKEIPSTIVYEDDKVLAFKDISLQAPVHVLVIPKFRDGLTQLGKAEQRHGEILGQLLLSDAPLLKLSYPSSLASSQLAHPSFKGEKDWTRRIGNNLHLICIEDPFVVSHDLGRVVDKFSIKALREEFERAANVTQYDPNP